MSADIPGPRSRELSAQLRALESRNVTYIDADFPIFWESASGAGVTDVDGNQYLDLTAGFGVANCGHGNPYVANAIHDQAGRLAHAMGDVHPSEVKLKLLEALSDFVPVERGKIVLSSTGAEAVETAIKTAVLAKRKSRFVAYEGAYHGLSLGTLSLNGNPAFRDPFSSLVCDSAAFLPYPRAFEEIETVSELLHARDDIAALLIEPILGRGGVRVPPPGYIAALRELCTMTGVLLIVDEVFTGFGRTGTPFACDYEEIEPDILCVGKALGNGFPISAAIARASVMDAWPESTGEALHTSTFLGNPMGCAAGLAVISEMRKSRLPERANVTGELLAQRLSDLASHARVREVRGRGLMWGIELQSGDHAARVVKAALRKGVLLLQAGPAGDVLSLTPPLTIEPRQLLDAVDTIEALL